MSRSGGLSIISWVYTWDTGKKKTKIQIIMEIHSFLKGPQDY